MLPRVDVGYGALSGAVTALIMLVLGALLQGAIVDWAVALPPLLVVVVMGSVAYFVPADIFSKELAAGIAGAGLVIVQFIISARRGEVVDTALVAVAVTYFVQLIATYVLPRIQPEHGNTSLPH